MAQAHKNMHKQTGKFIENAASQAITKPQETTVPTSATLNTNTQNVTYASSPYNLHQTPTWHTVHPNMEHTLNGTMHPAYRYQELQTPTLSNSPEQQTCKANTNLNQSVVDLLRHQTDLTQNTQCLHQQTTDALYNIAKSSALQKNVHFINDIPMFKAKDPQSFNDWLDQIDKVTALTNNDPYKLVLAKSQGSSSKTISSCPSILSWNKIKECLH